MCPVCLTTAAVIAGSATGSGGLAAFITRIFRRKRSGSTNPAAPLHQEDHHGSHSDRNSVRDNPTPSL